VRVIKVRRRGEAVEMRVEEDFVKRLKKVKHGAILQRENELYA